MKILNPEQALARAQRMCASSEQCTSDIREKLRRWGVAEHHATTIIDHLVEEKYIDNTRYARAFAHDKVCFAGWGRYKIVAHLVKRRIPRDIINEAIDHIDPDQYNEALQRALRTKARQLGPEMRQRSGWQKMLRFAIGRGFEYDNTIKALRQALWLRDLS